MFIFLVLLVILTVNPQTPRFNCLALCKTNQKVMKYLLCNGLKVSIHHISLFFLIFACFESVFGNILVEWLLAISERVRLGKWNFQGWIYRLKYIPGRDFRVPTSTPSPSREPWNLPTWQVTIFSYQLLFLHLVLKMQFLLFE